MSSRQATDPSARMPQEVDNAAKRASGTFSGTRRGLPSSSPTFRQHTSLSSLRIAQVPSVLNALNRPGGAFSTLPSLQHSSV